MPKATKVAKRAKMSLINSWDYMSVVTPNGRFTLGRYGTKASGRLSLNPAAFDRINDWLDNHKDMKNKERMALLATPEVMDTLWPEWDAVHVNPFKVGAKVRVDGRPKYGTGVVESVKPKTATVRFPGHGLVVAPFELLLEAK